MGKIFDFNEQLKNGVSGEEIFYRCFASRLRREDGRKHDFFDMVTKEYLELKSDSYDATQTPNFFIERYSSIATKSDGGPWQALKNGNHKFVYFFVKNGIYYVFDLPRLVTHLDERAQTYKFINIQNRGWTTQGYKVKRAELDYMTTCREISNYQQIIKDVNGVS